MFIFPKEIGIIIDVPLHSSIIRDSFHYTFKTLICDCQSLVIKLCSLLGSLIVMIENSHSALQFPLRLHSSVPLHASVGRSPFIAVSNL